MDKKINNMKIKSTPLSYKLTDLQTDALRFTYVKITEVVWKFPAMNYARVNRYSSRSFIELEDKKCASFT